MERQAPALKGDMTMVDTENLSIGHLALHYSPADDGPKAARLLELIGFSETQMLPLPQGNFYRFVVNDSHFARGDGVIYLSSVPAPQAALVEAIRSTLKVGTADEHAAVDGMRAMLEADPEASFHLGFLVPDLEHLEAIVARLQQAAQHDPELKGRIELGFNRARPGDADVDTRLDASPVFGPVTRYAYGRNGVQVFIKTDLLKSGTLGESAVLELDYIFPNKSSHILSVVEL